MTLRRLTARGAVLTLSALLFAAAGAGAASSANIPRLVFPVVGEVQYTDDFGDARAQGSHEGNDIMAPRRATVVAAEAGTVKFWTTSARAGCMLYLYGGSGTTYLYIHLNNDLGQGNDNRGACIPGVAYAPGLKNGAKVAAGQPIAFNGNSGDADSTATHTQFEIHPGGGGPVNPYPYLRAARKLLFAAKPGTAFSLAVTGTVAGAGDGALRLSVDQVRQWPGGKKIEHPGQKIMVSVPEAASVEGVSSAAAGLAFPALELLTTGMTVTVWTAPAKVTLAAQTGAKGALAASRVVVKP